MTTEETTPEPKKFDLKAALIGREYPENTVAIFLNEADMFRFGKVVDKANHMDKDAEVERDKMILDLADSVIWVTVRGVPRDVLGALDLQMLKEFPVEGLETEGIVARNKEFDTRIWQLHVVAYKDPQGVVHTTSREDIELLISGLPDASKKAVEAAIRELRDVAQSGYENAVMELGFLSLP